MRRVASLCAALALLAINSFAQDASRLQEVVQIEHGTLRGTPRDAQGVLTYKGIPFTAPPVGALRWQAPQTVKPWNDVHDATRVGNRCVYNVSETGLGGHVADVPQSEDCLYLNVWTTAVSANDRQPVMVWIHGGGFQFGTGRDLRTDGALLSRKGVIVVSMNYRMGVFGFFGHPQLRHEGRLAGNFGLLDQIAALKWVQANVAKFGGDPRNVTIFGESAGSQAVSLLMSSPLAKGLFHKAIGQSGSSLQDLPTLGELGMRGAAFAGALGAKNLEELRAMPTQKIVAANAWDFSGGAPMVFAPGIDGYLLPEQVADVFRKGRQNDVPLLAGYNKREDFPFQAETMSHRTSAEFRAAALIVFGPEKMQEFNALYQSDTDASAKASAQELLGDIRQRAETWRWLTLQTQTGKAAAWGYIFSFESPYSPVASHGADMPFVFGNLVPQFFAPKAAPAGDADRKLAADMMSYWVNFAAKGDPNGPGLAPWPPFKDRGSMLLIQEDGRLAAGPPSDKQLAKFRFLDGFLTSASTGLR